MNLDVLEKSLAWKKSYNLAKEIYELTWRFPQEEKYVMVAQIRRSAISVSSNIAEGRFRSTKREFIYFLYVAKGSCSELSTQIQLAYDFKYISKDQYQNIRTKIIEILKILQASINTLKRHK